MTLRSPAFSRSVAAAVVLPAAAETTRRRRRHDQRRRFEHRRPVRHAAAEGFRDETGTNVTVGISGTGGGFERFCRGETDLSNASRPIDEDEAAICEENGVEYLELQVANDALTVVVNPRERLGDMPHGRASSTRCGSRAPR